MNPDAKTLNRLQRIRLVAELLAMGCAILAVAWIPVAVRLIAEDAAMRRNAGLIFWYLLPRAVMPMCGFVVGWIWRSLLNHKIRKLKERSPDRVVWRG